MKRFKKNNKGFSLVELIVVIAIMAILGVAVALAVTKFIPQSQRSTDISNATMIAEAVEVAVNDFATAPDGKINTVEKNGTGTGDGYVFNGTLVNLKGLVKTGLLKSEPTVQGTCKDTDGTTDITMGTNFYVTYTESTGKVEVFADSAHTKLNLMDSDVAKKYKEGTLKTS